MDQEPYHYHHQYLQHHQHLLKHTSSTTGTTSWSSSTSGDAGAPAVPGPGPVSLLNWSHVKPEFSGKPDADAEVHLFWKIYWITTQAFAQGVKIQPFCLVLIGECRLWYVSIRPVALDWNGLQALFRQQYLCISNTCEQLFTV